MCNQPLIFLTYATWMRVLFFILRQAGLAVLSIMFKEPDHCELNNTNNVTLISIVCINIKHLYCMSHGTGDILAQ